MLYAVTPTLQVGDPLLVAAEAIGDRFWTVNAMSARPLPVSRGVPMSLIVSLWGTAEARRERFSIYARAVGLARRRVTRSLRTVLYPGGMTEEWGPGDYAGIIVNWIGRKIELPAEQVIGLAETSLQVLNWSRVNYPSAPVELGSDVILSMLGYFGLAEGELITEEEVARQIAEGLEEQIGPETTPTKELPDEITEPVKYGAWFLGAAFIAGVLVALTSGRR